MGLEILFLLLPVAALSGWWIGRRSAVARAPDSRAVLSADYFKGLNYLLNEQPDEAIEVFIRMLEVDSETVETHFALGNLFLRRGEVDRAIRIHQNLIARPTLSREQRNQAVFELGRDYMRAGLLDRAESLFTDLVEDGTYGVPSLRQLLDIFQQEKEWDRAITTARRFEGRSGRKMQTVIAQYFCELSEEALHRGSTSEALKLVKRALSEDRKCVRASLIEADILLKGANPKAALKVLHRVEQQDPAYLPEIIAPLHACYTAIQRPGEMMVTLRDMLSRHPGMSTMLALSEQIQREEGEAAAVAFITGQLRQRPTVRGMARLIELKLGQVEGALKEELTLLGELTQELLSDRAIYQCGNCGFHGKALHWQCPSCKEWNTIKPIQGLEGE